MQIKNQYFRKIFSFSLSVFLLVACSGGDQAPETSVNSESSTDLTGKTITILVGYSPGGGTDTTARLLNRYLGKHTEGRPQVIVQNMTGAAGIRALNYTFEKARPDGQTLLLAPISLLVPLLGEPGIRYELSKFDVVGGLRSGPLVQLARKDLLDGGLNQAAQITTVENLRIGGIRTSSSLDLMARLAIDTLGAEHKYVTGYSNENTVRNAFQNKEVNTFNSTFAGYKSAVIPTLIDTDIASPLWQFPYREADGSYPRSDFAPDVPTFMEVYEEIKGVPPSGEHWQALRLALDLRSVADNMLLAPPGTDAAALAALREGFAKAVQDPEMIAEVNKVLGYFYGVVPLDFISQRFEETKDLDADSIEFIKQYIAEGDL